MAVPLIKWTEAGPRRQGRTGISDGVLSLALWAVSVIYGISYPCEGAAAARCIARGMLDSLKRLTVRGVR